MTLRPGSLEMLTGWPVVVGRVMEGRVVLLRWLQAPSSFGTGRSLGVDVSIEASCQ